jgi:class 3 adenylate cyclase
MPAPSPESFVSRTLRARLAERLPLTEPELREHDGAVLLSDIQGFTRMVEQFSRRGPTGLEDVTWALNGYFADVVETVQRLGGDVIAIAGDSFLCLWTAEGDISLEEATMRAGQAALSIQAVLHDREAMPGMHFRTRIGIGCGPVKLTFVGGAAGQWQCLLRGSAYKAAVRAESLAEPGQVILSPLACETVRSCGGLLVQADAHGRLEQISWPTPPLPPLLPPVDPERLLPCVPAAVLHRIDLPSPEWLAEFRLVSLFLATVSPANDAIAADRDQLEQTHEMIRAFQQVVADFGGAAKVDIDAKGNLLSGFWGLPPHADEDDALRAVEAAWALRQQLACGQQLSIGVATGRALCGAFGSDSRRDYIVRGEVITVAARLMQAAQGGILADLETIKAARHRIDYDQLPPITVKGRTQPLEAVKPRRRRRRLLADSSMIIGRAAEQALLNAGLDRLLECGRGTTWLIEAEAGLGKSMLVQALANRALGLGAKVLVGSAEAIDRHTAFAAWRGVFHHILGGEDGPALQAALVQRLQTSPDLVRLAPLASAVVPIELEDSSLTAEMTGEVRSECTRRLLSGILADFVQDRPTVLIFEDGHWADTGSAALLTDISKLSDRLLIVATTRPVEARQRRILADLDSAQVICLSPLHDDEVDHLVRSELGVRSASSRLLGWIRERVGGHPFFAAELVRAVRSTDVVMVQGGRCTVGNLDELSLPATIEGIVTSRLNQLCSSQQLTLKVAAVIGRVFTEPIVRAIHPSQNQIISEHLLNFVRQDITIPDYSKVHGTYEFRHALLRDVAYDQMSQIQRRSLHRAVASWLEREHQERLAPVASLLAGHWERAQDNKRTIRFLELAGEHALRSGTFHEAETNFQQALVIAAKMVPPVGAERCARWQMGLGVAAYFLGNLVESRRRLEAALAVLDRRVPATAAETWRRLLLATITQARHRLLGIPRLSPDDLQRQNLDAATDCYRILSQIYFLHGEPVVRLAYLTFRAVNLGERGGDSASLARALANLGVLMSLTGFKKWSEWYGSQSVSMAEQQGQYAASAYVRSIDAIRLATNGRPVEALQRSTEALERIVALGDFSLEQEAMSVRAMIATTNGFHDIALPAARRCVELARNSGSLATGGWALFNLVEVALARADLPGAQAALAEGRALLVGLTDVGTLALQARAEAILAEYEGRWDDALRSARAVISLIDHSMPTAYYIAEAYAVALRVLVAGSSEGYAVSRRELRGAARTLCKLSRNFWNVRAQAKGFARQLLRRRIG